MSQLNYVYDMGDSCEHLITIEAATTDSIYPRLIAGARCGPPEDIGGFPSDESFLKWSPTGTTRSMTNSWNGMVVPMMPTTSTNHGSDGG